MDISYNKIKSIDKEIQKLKKLEEIIINNNKIEAVPKEIKAKIISS